MGDPASTRGGEGGVAVNPFVTSEGDAVFPLGRDGALIALKKGQECPRCHAIAMLLVNRYGTTEHAGCPAGLKACGCDDSKACEKHSCAQCGAPLDEGGVLVGGDRYCDDECRWNGADDDERPPSDRAVFRAEAPYGSER